MHSDRYPKICFNRLLELSTQRNIDPRYNWIMQINGTCTRYIDNFTIPDNTAALKNLRDLVIAKHMSNRLDEDWTQLNITESLLIYPFLPLRGHRQPYLTNRLSLNLQRTMAQCRLMGTKLGRIIIGEDCINFTNDPICKFCFSQKTDNLHHMVMECPAHFESRIALLNTDEDSFTKILCPESPQEVAKLHNFLLHTLRREKNSN